MEILYRNRSFYLLVLWVSSFYTLSLCFSPIDNYLINCGSAVDTIVDNRKFTGESSSSNSDCRFLSSTRTIRVRNENPNLGYSQIYHTARVFERPSRYEFETRDVGTHMVRLHFHGFNSTKLDLDCAEFHVLVNGFVLLSHFSGMETVSPRVIEYLIWVDSGKAIITFLPTRKSKFAFVNAIEVISAPKDLILDDAQSVDSENVEKFVGLSKQAFEVVYRVTVGGPKVTPFNDSLWRTWIPDDDFLQSTYGSNKVYTDGWINYRMGGASREVGPDNVYNSARVISSTNASIPNVNLTWVFPVIGGYKYLVRMHFCDIASISLGTIYFNVYVNGNLAYQDLDLWYVVGELASPFYADFVVDGGSSGLLNVSVGPSNSSRTYAIDAILNGVEILKMNNSMGSLDGQFCAKFLLNSWPRHNVAVLVPLVAVACLLLILSLISFRRTTRAKDSVAWSPLPVDVSEVSLKHFRPQSSDNF